MGIAFAVNQVSTGTNIDVIDDTNPRGVTWMLIHSFDTAVEGVNSIAYDSDNESYWC